MELRTTWPWGSPECLHMKKLFDLPSARFTTVVTRCFCFSLYKYIAISRPAYETFDWFVSEIPIEMIIAANERLKKSSEPLLRRQPPCGSRRKICISRYGRMHYLYAVVFASSVCSKNLGSKELRFISIANRMSATGPHEARRILRSLFGICHAFRINRWIQVHNKGLCYGKHRLMHTIPYQTRDWKQQNF